MRDFGIDPIAIDVSRLIERQVASLYSHLVTRPTGRAVRMAIENQLGDAGQVTLSLIDLSEVTVLDFSCADEVIAKLILAYLPSSRPREAFFVFRGVRDPHRGPIQAVLERHELAAVADAGDGRFELIGMRTDEEARMWHFMEVRGVVPRGQMATLLPREADHIVLQHLAERRLVFRRPASGDFHALSRLVRDLIE